MTRRTVRGLRLWHTLILLLPSCGAPPQPDRDEPVTSPHEAPLDTHVTAPSWTLRLDGIGPVRVGMTIAEMERAIGGAARIDRLEPGDGCGYAYLDGVPEGISFMVSGDTIVRAHVNNAGFLDEAGLGVGSPEADVLARRAGMIRVEPHPYTGPEGHYLIVDNPARPGFRLIYETDGRRVITFRAGRLPEADYIEGCA